MELISKDTAIRVVDSGRNRQQLVDMMKAVPTIPAIPMERIKQLREEMKDVSFSHYFEMGEYIGEDTKKWEILKLQRALEFIDNMIKEYSK